MAENPKQRIIHVGKIFGEDGLMHYLLLKQTESNSFKWSQCTTDLIESETGISAPSISEAIRLAKCHWKERYFQPLNCGFRYTLPERDEHGMNALFYQMTAAYSSMNGIYFDEELGNNCIVNFASDEAKQLWKKMKSANMI